ncbi:MAG: ribonuclease H-like YkuK family protein [Patescibacteria group bacterium]
MPQTKIETIETLNSPTHGWLQLPDILGKITEFVSSQPDRQYKIIIGTDSQSHNGSGTDFVTALVVHRVGGGGIYFWKSYTKKRPYQLKERMYEEALTSIEFANSFITVLKDAPRLLEIGLEIHVDVGENGRTRDIINEIVSMVRGNGYEVKTKPDSFGASNVADRHA